MRRALTGIIAAVTLAASQAAAGSNGPLVHVGDRAGPGGQTANEMMGGMGFPAMLLALAIVVTFVVVVSHDDNSSSP